MGNDLHKPIPPGKPVSRGKPTPPGPIPPGIIPPIPPGIIPGGIAEQAIEVSEALRGLTRRLSTLDTEGPTADLPVAQLRVCGILYDGPRTMSCLGKELGISLSAVTQIADRLERSRLVERIVEADDHRMRRLQLTGHGRQVVEARRSTRLERVLDALGKLSAEERDIAVQGLRVLLGAAVDASPV